MVNDVESTFRAKKNLQVNVYHEKAQSPSTTFPFISERDCSGQGLVEGRWRHL